MAKYEYKKITISETFLGTDVKKSPTNQIIQRL